ncbi:serine/threonine-protein kinase phg2-like [Copidosoma floridanum]|uniref:serine/threonine-protein kinase phg2-like n=1 Tax=Copidosoma floridanum TaxID=29053 RepID=UPI0006C983B3|nr:serine/threonine-protein kinase phg2-like [Copidosoma floridanum]
MDASSARASCSADEATLLPLSFSSLPPSHYLQTFPRLLTTSSLVNKNHHHNNNNNNNNDHQHCNYNRNSDNNNNNNNNNNSTNSNNSVNHRLFRCNGSVSSAQITGDSATREPELAVATSCQSLGNLGRSTTNDDGSTKSSDKENGGSSSSRSTSSPQLMSRSKVYRRASLKSLTSLSSTTSQPAQSRIVRLGRVKIADKRGTPLDHVAKTSNTGSNNSAFGDKKVPCQAFSQPVHRSPDDDSSLCSKSKKENSNGVLQQVEQQQLQEEEKQQQQQTKGKSCSSFLPILSLIPNMVISFQYPSPKMKFSWWRNKIS